MGHSPRWSHQNQGGLPPLPSSPSSKDEGSTYSAGEPDGSSGDERRLERLVSNGWCRQSNQHGHNHWWQSWSSSSSDSKSLIKPIAPKEYDRQADARAYHCFVRESKAYLWDGKVKRRRQVFLLSYYLTGKAYNFYTQKVASNEGSWTLKQFYDELFNYCFPVDYQTQLRKNLSRCHQNERSISEYTHELHELFNMIGDVSEHDHILKFWNGTCPVTQVATILMITVGL